MGFVGPEKRENEDSGFFFGSEKKIPVKVSNGRIYGIHLHLHEHVPPAFDPTVVICDLFGVLS